MCRAIIVLTLVCGIVSGNGQWSKSWSESWSRSSSNRQKSGTRPVNVPATNQSYYNTNSYANNNYGSYPSYPVNYPTYGYGYGYGGNYATYPLNNQVYGSYRAPCQSSCGTRPPTACRSSCGSVQPAQPCRSSCGASQPIYTSYCRNLPCGVQQQQLQQQVSYYPYAYYGGGYGNNRVIYSPNNNNYQTLRTISASASDPYGNVPVEIVDEDIQNVGNLAPSRRNAIEDKYADVPTEIVDVDPAEFWRNIPRLPKVITSSNSSYTVSQGNISSESVQQSKPIQATITRSFQPLRPNQEFRLDFLNGAPVGDDSTEKKTKDENSVPTTTVVTTTEEEDEEVSALTNWLK